MHLVNLFRQTLKAVKPLKALKSRWLLLPFASLLVAATPASEVSPAQSTTLTRLLLRNHEVTISVTRSGETQYDVYAPSGESLELGLTGEQLQASYPALYDSLRPAVAEDAGDMGPLMLLWEPLD